MNLELVKKSISKIAIVFHPFVLYERIHWIICSKMLKSCGKGTAMGCGFCIIEPQNILMGDNVHFGHGCIVASYEYHFHKRTGYKPELIIGNDISFGNYCHISCLNKIIISDGVLTGDNVSIIDNFHGKLVKEEANIRPALRDLYSKGPVFIGKNVWIGKNVCILSNVKIGDYAIIGANAVVTHDIPSYAVAGGVPAKVIRVIK